MDTNEIYLKTDSSAIKNRIIISGAAVIVFCFVVSILFASLFNYTNRIKTLTIAILWISFMIMWALASIVAWKKLTKNKYILTNDSLIIKKYGISGSTEQFYRYDSFLTIEVKKNFMSKNSGKIIISIPKISDPLILDNIKDVNKQAKLMKSHVASNSKNTKSLIN